MKNFEFLLEKYNNPVIRALIQFVPFGIGGAIDVTLVQIYDNIRKERLQTYFDELDNGDSFVKEEILKSEDFLHAFFITTKCALNSRRREKTKMFARLLKNSLTDNDISNIDEYEDFLKILDDISYREFSAS